MPRQLLLQGTSGGAVPLPISLLRPPGCHVGLGCHEPPPNPRPAAPRARLLLGVTPVGQVLVGECGVLSPALGPSEQVAGALGAGSTRSGVFHSPRSACHRGRARWGLSKRQRLGFGLPHDQREGGRGLLAQGPRTGAGDPHLSLGASLIKHDFTPRRLNQQVLSEARHRGAFQKPGRSPGLSCWHRKGLDEKTVHRTEDLLVGRGRRPDGTSQRQVGGQPPSRFANLGAGRMRLSRWTSRGDSSTERSGPVTAGMCPSFLRL